jgi:oligopeptide transport system substrate-binding protein
MWIKKSMGAGLALIMLLAACQPSASESPGASETGEASEAPAVPQVLRVPLGTEPPSLDPNTATDSESIQVLRSITYPLVYFDENLNIVDGMASYEVSEDGQTITFHLSEGWAYSDGQPVVAGDFAYSWRRLIDPRTASEYAYVLDYVANGLEIRTADPEVDDIDAMLEDFGVDAPDDSTFVVTLSQPAAWFVYIATMWLTVPLREDMVFSEAEGYISSGPMMLTEWNHNANLVLEPNPNWNGPAPTIERIEMSVISDQAAELAADEAGDIDIAQPPAAEIPRIEDDPELSQDVLRGNSLGIEYYAFDLKDPNGPFARSALLRRAFHEAVDKEAAITVAFGGVGIPADSVVPPGMPGAQEDVFIPYDVEQAQADFAAALEELGLASAADLHLQIGYNTGSTHETRVEFLQQQWREAFGDDLVVEPVGMEFGTYLDRLTSDPFDIFRLGWGADYPHPQNFLFDLLGCGSGNNNAGYCNEEVDALMAEASVTADLEGQVALYNQAQELIMEDSPMITLRWGSRFTLIKPWVQDLLVTSLDSDSGEHFYAWATIAPHE